MTQTKHIFGSTEISLSNADMKRMTISRLSHNLREAFNRGYLLKIADELFSIRFVDAFKIEISNIKNSDATICTHEYLVNLGAELVPDAS